jgi:hypothetical protein
MAYNDDLDWNNLAAIASTYAQATIRNLDEGVNQYNEWQSYRAGRDNTAIASVLGVTVARVADLDAVFAAFKLIHDYATNVSASYGDYYYSLRKFA